MTSVSSDEARNAAANPAAVQQRVALAQGHVERTGEREHQVAARLRPAVLDEAQVARRHAGARRELLLADVTALPPGPQLDADRAVAGRPARFTSLVHGATA